MRFRVPIFVNHQNAAQTETWWKPVHGDMDLILQPIHNQLPHPPMGRSCKPPSSSCVWNWKEFDSSLPAANQEEQFGTTFGMPACMSCGQGLRAKFSHSGQNHWMNCMQKHGQMSAAVFWIGKNLIACGLQLIKRGSLALLLTCLHVQLHAMGLQARIKLLGRNWFSWGWLVPVHVRLRVVQLI